MCQEHDLHPVQRIQVGLLLSVASVVCRAACDCVEVRSGSPKEGREDGLVLNVNTPDLSSHRGLPVMVWIHGGG